MYPSIHPSVHPSITPTPQVLFSNRTDGKGSLPHERAIMEAAVRVCVCVGGGYYHQYYNRNNSMVFLGL
jgi:hypothetical protein